MKVIDQNNWKRKEIFDFFSQVSNPFYMTTFTLDVTNLYTYVKRGKLSFYYTLIFLCTKAMNQIENFMYSIEDDQLVELDHRIPSYTDMASDSDLFHITTMECGKDVFEFNKMAKQEKETQDVFIDLGKENNNLVYISCLPWMECTAITNEMDVLNPKFKDDSIPRLSWAKYVEADGRKKLNISIEVNHRFVDGIHIGKFVAELEKEINKLA